MSSSPTHPSILLRYVSSFATFPSFIFLAGRGINQRHFTPFSLIGGFPLALSAILGLYVVACTRRDAPKRIDRTMLLAMDIALGSVIMFMAGASYLLVHFTAMMERRPLRLGDPREWAMLPLIFSFCTHYFLAFSALENNDLVESRSERTYGTIRRRTRSRKSTPAITTVDHAILEKQQIAAYEQR